MNLRQPYEQLIAGKLRQLPAPDADASWQQMKHLLDEDEDRGGGAKRPPGKGGGWWRIGIIAVLLSAGLWMYVEKSAPDASLVKNDPAGLQTNTANSTNTSDNNKKIVIDNTTTLNSPVSNSTSQKTGEATNVAPEKLNNKSIAKTNNESADNKIATGFPAGNNNSVISGDAATNKVVKIEKSGTSKLNISKNTVSDQSIVADQNDLLASSNKMHNNNGRKNSAYNPVVAGNSLAGNNTTGNKTENKKDFISKDNTNHSSGDQEQGVARQNGNNGTANARTKNNNPINSNGIVSVAGNDNNTSNFNLLTPSVSIREKSFSCRWDELKIPGAFIPSANTALAAGDSIESNKDVTHLLTNDTKKQVAKAQRDNAIAIQDKKDKKGLHLNLSKLFQPFSLHVDPEPWWAAGLSLNAGIPVNAQSRFNYNMNGKSGSLTDYIPSPFLEFHLNNSVYIHTELNFVTPQYTPQLLAFRQTNDVTALAGVSEQKSIFIQKLYYFNWPVSLHYSPIRNFFFSAGLQFSSFQSGLASIQQTQYTTAIGPDHPLSFSNDILKFKDDSIAAKLPPNEWRWQAGAEYYWNRFTIGVRYNQSFKNLMTIPATSTVPATTIRNNAVLFFIRYNLFESKNKADKERDREPTRY